MSYENKEQEEQEEKKIRNKHKKLNNPLKTIITENTIVETAQDIIDRDVDSERRNEFKKAEEIIQNLDPESMQKRKKKKSKEKEEFNKTLAYNRQNELLREKSQEQNREIQQEERNKGMERGE